MKLKTIVLEVGNQVICDYCDADYSDSDVQGGFLFQSKAVCPECAPRVYQRMLGYGETHYIKAACPDNMSFKDWVLSLR